MTSTLPLRKKTQTCGRGDYGDAVFSSRCRSSAHWGLRQEGTQWYTWNYIATCPYNRRLIYNSPDVLCALPTLAVASQWDVFALTLEVPAQEGLDRVDCSATASDS